MTKTRLAGLLAALLLAASAHADEADDLRALQLLIAHKADVNVKAEGSGRTVLATAGHHGNADAIEIPKAAGAR